MAEIDVDRFLDVLSDGLTLQEDGPYLGDDAGLLIRERDTAIREALLDELESAMVKHYKAGNGEGLAFRCALGDMRTKYATPSGSSGGGENG